MINWLKDRLKEPTTYLGLTLFAQSAMVLTKSNPEHTEIVTGAIQSAAEPMAQGDYVGAGFGVLAALAAIFMREKAL